MQPVMYETTLQLIKSTFIEQTTERTKNTALSVIVILNHVQFN